MFYFKLDWRVRPRTLWHSTGSSGVPSILRTGGGSFLAFARFQLHILTRCAGSCFIKYRLTSVLLLSWTTSENVISSTYFQSETFDEKTLRLFIIIIKRICPSFVHSETPAVMGSRCDIIDPIFTACRRPVVDLKLEIQGIMDRPTFKLISFSITIL